MPQYSAFQPRPYRPRMSPFWFLDRWPYFKFILREMSAAFVAYFVIVMLLQIYAVETGAGAYARFQAWMASPVMIVINAVAFLAVAFHAITWFMLAPRVFVRHTMGNIIPDLLIAAPNFGAWFVASLVIALFALRII